MTKKYEERTYRNLIRSSHLQSFRVVVKETDLLVHACTNLEAIAKELVLQYRGYIESYIAAFPDFVETLRPWRLQGPAPKIVDDMARAGKLAGVGPMAAVAGALAEHVGLGLLSHSPEVIVENGGDVFLKTDEFVTVGIFAGKSPLSLQIGLQIDSRRSPQAVCTSSGTIGHSLSLGSADAICVVSGSCALADATATAIGNIVQSKQDIQTAIETAKTIEDIDGLAIIVDDDIGLWGDLEVVPLQRKKG
jgi:ApbE superfamily uncharacterized protein (UPF0280 family)